MHCAPSALVVMILQKEFLVRQCAKRRLDVVLDLSFPRQFIERRLVPSFPVTTFRDVRLLMFVIFNAGTVLIAPAISFSVDASRFH